MGHYLSEGIQDAVRGLWEDDPSDATHGTDVLRGVSDETVDGSLPATTAEAGYPASERGGVPRLRAAGHGEVPQAADTLRGMPGAISAHVSTMLASCPTSAIAIDDAVESMSRLWEGLWMLDFTLSRGSTLFGVSARAAHRTAGTRARGHAPVAATDGVRVPIASAHEGRMCDLWSGVAPWTRADHDVLVRLSGGAPGAGAAGEPAAVATSPCGADQS